MKSLNRGICNMNLAEEVIEAKRSSKKKLEWSTAHGLNVTREVEYSNNSHRTLDKIQDSTKHWGNITHSTSSSWSGLGEPTWGLPFTSTWPSAWSIELRIALPTEARAFGAGRSGPSCLVEQSPSFIKAPVDPISLDSLNTLPSTRLPLIHRPFRHHDRCNPRLVCNYSSYHHKLPRCGWWVCLFRSTYRGATSRRRQLHSDKSSRLYHLDGRRWLDRCRQHYLYIRCAWVGWIFGWIFSWRDFMRRLWMNQALIDLTLCVEGVDINNAIS